MKRQTEASKFTLILFSVYLLALFWIIVLKFNIDFTTPVERDINFIPYGGSLILNGKVSYGEMILNILIFIPLGIYAGLLFKPWNFAKQGLFFFSVSFICEMLQFIFCVGAFDITDLINNSLGGVIGFLVYSAVKKAFKTEAAVQKFINFVTASGTVIILAFLLFLKIKHLWLFRM